MSSRDPNSKVIGGDLQRFGDNKKVTTGSSPGVSLVFFGEESFSSAKKKGGPRTHQSPLRIRWKFVDASCIAPRGVGYTWFRLGFPILKMVHNPGGDEPAS